MEALKAYRLKMQQIRSDRNELDSEERRAFADLIDALDEDEEDDKPESLIDTLKYLFGIGKERMYYT